MSVTFYRSEYQPYPFAIPQIQLTFELDLERTLVTQEFELHPHLDHPSDCVLQGVELELLSIQVNGTRLLASEYRQEPNSLTLKNLSGAAKVTIQTAISPSNNKELMGLFASNGALFTQCEAEGFRKITYHPDRPDVLSTYTVTLRAPADRFPVLLSNGNLVRSSRTGNTLEAIWHDPFPKPSYLFALVAGDFASREEDFTTPKGKRCLLQVYSDKDSQEKTAFALQALKYSIVWDEQRFGLSIDLERFMIVATRDFSMGAMENKGLNIFNSAYVLAHPQYATDQNFLDVESVIGHEYFHNWTGNRITCRDWFQLSLKEGLTVFRDQEFSADQRARNLSAKAAESARAIKRIDDVTVLRSAQFPEDTSPIAHPIRPNSYESIDNFYTATIYEKGAEVIRMLHTLMGEQLFQKGMQIYIQRHDGQAVTCDDFVDAMETAYQTLYPHKNFTQFRLWYSQAGTPKVTVHKKYSADTKELHLSVEQICAPVGIELRNPEPKLPLHIPIKIAALGSDGTALMLNGQPEQLLELTEQTQEWVFHNIPEMPTLSLLRDFSAPITVEHTYSPEDLLLLLRADTNSFARWEAAQTLYRHLLLAPTPPQASDVLPALTDTLQAIFADTALDKSYIVQLFTLPSLAHLSSYQSAIDPLWLAKQRDALYLAIAQALEPIMLTYYRTTPFPINYTLSGEDIGVRALKNLCLSMLLATGNLEYYPLAQHQYHQANNFTERWGAVQALVRYSPASVFQPILDSFYTTYQNDPLVIDKWFTLQATCPRTTAKDIQTLLEHPAFVLSTPNRARALIFQFCLQNPYGFYHPDQSGFSLLQEMVIQLDQINPAIAARLVRTLDRWRSFAKHHQQPMLAVLEHLQSLPDLSPNLREIVSKSLESPYAH